MQRIIHVAAIQYQSLFAMQDVSCVCDLWFGWAVGTAIARVVISQTDRRTGYQGCMIACLSLCLSTCWYLLHLLIASCLLHAVGSIQLDSHTSAALFEH